MNPRVEYEMSEDDLKDILAACKPVPCMMFGSYTPPSPQENANRAWAVLGSKMGFDSMTVRTSDKGQRFFTAVQSETENQRTERIKREQEELRQKEIEILKAEIRTRTERLQLLL